MKTVGNILLAGMMTMLWCSVGRAQIIYSNAFNGGAVSIYHSAPTASSNYAGGTSSAWWTAASNSATAYVRADGTIGTSLTTFLLPFTPHSGYVYTLTASVTVPTMTSGNWFTMGFAANMPPLNSAPDPRFGSTYVNGNPWTSMTEGVNCAFWPTRTYHETDLPNLMPTPGTYTVQLKLDTTGGQWIASEFVNGTQIGTNYIYNPNPTITGVGVGQTTLSSSTGIKWNYLALTSTGSGRTNTVNATVSFSGAGLPLNPAFVGLSYEKLGITNDNFFTANNTPLVKLFSMIGPAVLRIGGATADAMGWGGLSNTIPITASDVDTFAGFVQALPTNWSVIYGLNLISNNAAYCAAEASYVKSALGSRLLGFAIGNEPEFYYSTYSSFLSRWQTVAATLINDGYPVVGMDAGQGVYSWNDSFASDESGVASMLLQHYYRGAGGQSSDTMQLLLQPDPYLLTILNNLVPAASAAHFALGTRIDECASYSAGGVVNLSETYGTALWSLDFMLTAALNGCQGINFHGGGRSPYTPIMDNGTSVQQVRPEFYGLKMFSLLPHGNVVPATVTLASNINFTAYGVRQADGTISALLNNKEVSDAVAVSVNLGPDVSGAQLIELTGPNLYSTNGYTLGGATINPNGTWAGGVQTVLPATNGVVTVDVPPISAILLNPLVVSPETAFSVNGNQLTLSWPTNYAGWLLESNSIGLGTPNWFPVPGSGNTNRVQITIQPGQDNVFYRLSSP